MDGFAIVRGSGSTTSATKASEKAVSMVQRLKASKQVNITELKTRCRGRWPEILTTIGGIGSDFLTGRNGPCPRCGGSDRWRVFGDFDETGGALCNKCGQGQTGGGMADGFAVIAWHRGCDFKEAVRLVAAWIESRDGPSRSTTAKSGHEPREFSTLEGAIVRARSLVWKSEKIDPGEPVKIYQYGPDNCGRTEWEARFEFFRNGERQKASRPISTSGGKFFVKALIKPRPLYRLQQLAENTSNAVVICEGPKATDAAVGLGYIATTSPGGSSNARNADWSSLAGRNVVILPDADKPGEKYARQVAEELDKLTPPASSIKIVELPGLNEGEDLVEWIERGGTREELDQIIENTEVWTSSEKEDSLPDITNVKIVGSDDDEKTIPLTMSEIMFKIYKTSGDWPRRVGRSLFVHDNNEIQFLKSAPALFAFLGRKHGIIHWLRITGCSSKEEVFCELQRTATSYKAIENLPHWPLIEGHYYTCKPLIPGDGKTLEKFLSFFCPQTNIDRQLLCSAICTPLWGGLPGSRPAFLFTCSAGRGKGKSAIVKSISQLYQGAIDISLNEDVGTLKNRLLSPNAASKRIAVLDNVKTMRFSWAELESMLTASEINGKELYVGDSSRPNYLTWFITLNGASLSTDLTQRVIEVQLAPPKYGESWESDVYTFIENYRTEILCDLAAILSRPSVVLKRLTRWALWENSVLSRMEDPSECIDEILKRRQASDVEQEEGEIIEDFFANKLRGLGYDPDRVDVFIPNAITAKWFNLATGESKRTTGVTRTLKQLHDERIIWRLQPYRAGASSERGTRWIGTNADCEEPISMDIRHRIAKQLED